MSHQEWLKEFRTFCEMRGEVPPNAVSTVIMSRVRADLNPSISVVAAKYFGFHSATALAILFFCPQLGVGPIVGSDFIMDVFMRFGPLLCAVFCGALFLGTGTFVSTLMLRREELRVANCHRLLITSLTVTFTFSGLMLAGGESDQWSYLFWLAGAMTGSWSTLVSTSRLRLAAILSA